MTLFLDLSTFYETISHQRLEQTAYESEDPATLLNIAVQIYRGARVLTADSGQDMSVWRRGDFVIRLDWGDPSTRTRISDRLRMAMCQDRWRRIASQESASGVEQGIDWTIPRKLLKQAAKRPLVASGLRMLCQGAIRRAGHGGDLLCPGQRRKHTSTCPA